MFPAPACAAYEFQQASHDPPDKALERTMFSITQITLVVSLCARLIPSATFLQASSIEHAPTVDPGLQTPVRADKISRGHP
jgi:hypothetical protein